MSTQRFFDVHTHTHFSAFSGETDAVIQRALDASVWMVNVGTQQDTSKGALETAERYKEGVYAAVGLHPIHTEQSYHDLKELGASEGAQATGMKGFESRGEDFDYEYYKQLALHPKVVAIGECGLDYYRLTEETKEKQKNVFEKQIHLSIDVKKPLMIHCRNAFSDLIKVFDSYPMIHDSSNPGVIHFFTGTVGDARALLDLGFSFSFGGVVTFTRDYDEALRYISLDRILSETDAPYVTPVPYRGKRNEPLYVQEVVKHIAEIRNEPLKRVQGALFENAKRIFGL